MAKREKSQNPAANSTVRGGINAREAMGTSAYTLADVPSNAAFKSGMPKTGNSKGGFAEAATAVPRHGVPHRTNGPRLSISVNLPGPQAPEATLTQGNGRIIPPKTRRSVDSFWQGSAS